MPVKRNRLDAGEALENRVMLSGTVPGAESQPAEADQAPAESADIDNGIVVAEGEQQDINNPEGGQITSDGTAIEVNGESTINNAGEIAGAVNGVDFAENGTGTLNNAETGVVSSDSRAVQINGDDVTINNQGAIVGTDDQRNGTVYSNRTADDFTINNQGLIDAGEGNEGAGISTELVAEGTEFDVNNDGLIQGRGNASAGAATAGDGIRLERTRVNGALDGTTTGLFEGTINNNGTIDSEGANGTVAGVRAVNGVDFQGTLNNNGTISGVQNGVYFGNATPAGGGDHSDGVVNNNGTISSGSRALNIDGTGLEVNNNGQIIGTGDQRNGTVYADSTAQDFTLNNNGLIDAGEGNNGAGFSVELDENGNEFTINNNGQLQGRGNAAAGAATAGDGIRLERSRVDGVLDGTTTGLFAGDITNNGSIDSEGANGTVAGFRAVNGVDFQGTLTNNGEISGVQNGVYFGNATPAGGGNNVGGVVENNGTISSGSRAFNIDGTGLEINNNGEIVGTGDQRNGTVYADETAQDFTLNNEGLIDAGEGNLGAGFSVELDENGNNFTINNEGTLQGRGNASAGAATAGDGIRLERTRVGGVLDGTTTGLFTGTITNSGLVDSEGANGTAAGFRAVNGVDFQGELNNTGTISGTQNGVYFGNATPAGGGNNVGGVVNNEGTISSDSRAFNIDGTGLTVNNSGQILATGTQRNGTFYADSTAQDFTLNNSGSIDAGAGLEGAAFSAELSAEGNDFTINNSGLLQGRGNAGAGGTTAGDGIRLERGRVNGLLDGSTTGLFTGTIINSGQIDSEGANGTVGGFRAVNGVGFQGTLENTGEIAGVQNGVYFGTGDHNGGVVNNSGTISSDSRAVNIDGDGLVLNNTGSIEATGRQRNGTVYADATADNFAVINSGSIDARGGAGSGVSIQVGSEAGDVQNASISNSGLIAGAGDLPEDVGVRLFTSVDAGTTFNGDITNSGTITAETGNAVLVEDGVLFDGDFINSGTVDGGIDLSSGDVVLTSESVVTLDITSEFQVEQIDTTGDVTFGGTLQVNFADGFVPEAGQTFDLIDFGVANGQFDAVQSDQAQFDISNLAIDGTVTVLGEVDDDGELEDDNDDDGEVDDDVEEQQGFSLAVNDQPLASLTTDQTPEELIVEATNDNLYFNVHTNDFPGGEIRGQLELKSDKTVYGVRTIRLEASLDSAQEPDNASDSDATGYGTVTIVDNGKEVTYSSTLSIDGIQTSDLLPVAGVSSIHLHNAPAGVNGPVITDIIQDAGGDINGNAVVESADTGDGNVFVENFGDDDDDDRTSARDARVAARQARREARQAARQQRREKRQAQRESRRSGRQARRAKLRALRQARRDVHAAFAYRD